MKKMKKKGMKEIEKDATIEKKRHVTMKKNLRPPLLAVETYFPMM